MGMFPLFVVWLMLVRTRRNKQNKNKQREQEAWQVLVTQLSPFLGTRAEEAG